MIGLQPTSVGARAVRYLRSIEDRDEWVFTIPLAFVLGVPNAKTLPVLLKHVVRLGLLEKRRRVGQKQAEWRARPGSWKDDDPEAGIPIDEPGAGAPAGDAVSGNRFLRHPNWPPGFVSQWDTVFKDWTRRGRDEER